MPSDIRLLSVTIIIRNVLDYNFMLFEADDIIADYRDD